LGGAGVRLGGLLMIGVGAGLIGIGVVLGSLICVGFDFGGLVRGCFCVVFGRCKCRPLSGTISGLRVASTCGRDGPPVDRSLSSAAISASDNGLWS